MHNPYIEMLLLSVHFIGILLNQDQEDRMEMAYSFLQTSILPFVELHVCVYYSMCLL